MVCVFHLVFQCSALNAADTRGRCVEAASLNTKHAGLPPNTSCANVGFFMSVHHFEISDAEKHGVNAAIILHNLRFWIDKNIANDRHIHDGECWTYNSVKAFERLFPYLSGKQIRSALQKLEDSGEIKKGNYNQSSYDRTTWYCIVGYGHHHLPKKENGFSEKGEPIPDNKPDNKPDNNPPIVPHDDITAEFDEWWSGYPRKTAKQKALDAYKRARKKQSSGFLLSKMREYAVAVAGNEKRFILHGATWLNGERWDDDLEAMKHENHRPGGEQSSFIDAHHECVKLHEEGRNFTLQDPF